VPDSVQCKPSSFDNVDPKEDQAKECQCNTAWTKTWAKMSKGDTSAYEIPSGQTCQKSDANVGETGSNRLFAAVVDSASAQKRSVTTCQAKCDTFNGAAKYMDYWVGGTFDGWCNCYTTCTEFRDEPTATITFKNLAYTRCACDYVGHATHPDCTSGTECQCTGDVRFGYGNDWTAWRYVPDSVQCKPSSFDNVDPKEDQAKECQCNTAWTKTWAKMSKGDTSAYEIPSGQTCQKSDANVGETGSNRLFAAVVDSASAQKRSVTTCQAKCDTFNGAAKYMDYWVGGTFDGWCNCYTTCTEFRDELTATITFKNLAN